MTTDFAHDLDNPVDDRYSPPPCGELDEIRAVLDDGRLSGGAQILPVYERTLAHRFGAARAIAVNSGTSALHAALIAFDVRPGTEVLVPATAPLPTAMPILTCGATPVPVDTLPNSLALDPTDVDRKLTARTRAAITLPLWGYPNDERAIAGLLADAGVPTIEDAAQAHGTRIANQHAGTLGHVGCFSTHDRKLLSTGEGGFILTNDQDLADRIDHYTHLGHLRGGHGVNYKLAGPLAAIGLRRLTHLDAQLAQRRRNAERILAALPPGGPLRELPYGVQDKPNYYNLVLIATARQPEIAAAFHAAGLSPDSIRWRYQPLYHQPLFQPYATACPNAEHLATATIQLPVHPQIAEKSVAWISDQTARIAQGETTA
ncbi:DegT/DnrJ/EryC1/StrS family aminotransferase [Micromonospora marina]|uniref:DegT/DnrJ/EryC1/StrS family aminotransferase n=1 Tax=Micromonospora marina TaxID=307120 RepID=UPI003D70B68B